MKTNMFTLLLVAVAVVCATGDLIGQTVWIKDTHNPIFSGGGTGSWDHHVFMSNVLYNADSSRYEMWFAGSYGPPWRPYRIGFAWSTDGINWTKYAGNPVFSPDAGAWDESSVEAPRVIRQNGQYKMWYAGLRNSLYQVGYATSPDGIHWTKDSHNPVLQPGASGWEGGSIFTGAVVPTPGGYTMFYGGVNVFSLTGKVGRATSVDGFTWQKDTLHSPVLDVGTSGQWDDAAVFAPTVIPLGDTLCMYFLGWRSNGSLRQVGLATSTDGGITWTRYGGNPILTLGPAGSWDGSYVEAGTVLRRDGILHMWYDGSRDPAETNLWRIGHATSSVAARRLVPSHYSTIQAGIDASLHGDTVLVDEGTYYENIRYHGKRIVVGSHYVLDNDTSHISRTIINGSTSTNADSGSVVYFVNGEDTTSVLCGFTITGGKGTKVSPGLYYAYDMRGGGVYLSRAGARINHNTVTSNTISTSGSLGVYGAGIGAFGDGTSFVILENNDIHHNSTLASTSHAGGGGIASLGVPARVRGNIVADNTASTQATTSNTVGGGIVAVSPNLFVFDNVIARNQSLSPNCPTAAWGGGIHVVNTNMQFRNNQVLDNLVLCASSGSAYGGGVSVAVSNEQGAWPQDEIVIEANYVSGNQAIGADWCTGGGVFVMNEKPLIQNNIIVKNTAFSGGGVGMIQNNYITPLTPTLINNTMTLNTSTSNVGGGIASRGSWAPTVINCIVWGDLGNQEISNLDGSAVVVFYSDIQGGWPGIANRNADPAFVAGDSLYHLDPGGPGKPVSPCIGAGIDSLSIGGIWFRAPAWDYAGLQRHRPVGPQPVDMGAQEEQITTDVSSMEMAPMAYVLEQNYPNPFNPSTTIRFALPHRSHVTLTVFNTLGQQIARLVNGDIDAGFHDIKFDGVGLASGVYFYRLLAGNFVQTRKLCLVR